MLGWGVCLRLPPDTGLSRQLGARHCWGSHAPVPCSRRFLQAAGRVTLTHVSYSVSGWRLSGDSNIYADTSKGRGHRTVLGSGAMPSNSSPQVQNFFHTPGFRTGFHGNSALCARGHLRLFLYKTPVRQVRVGPTSRLRDSLQGASLGPTF